MIRPNQGLNTSPTIKRKFWIGSVLPCPPGGNDL